MVCNQSATRAGQVMMDKEVWGAVCVPAHLECVRWG